MLKILEEPLVQKYFCHVLCRSAFHQVTKDKKCFSENCRAYAILEAMETPIEIGDKFLLWRRGSGVTEFPYSGGNIAGTAIRLPDAFQTKPDPVEEKIKEIVVYHQDVHVLKETASLDQRLRELVKLAKEQEK